MESARLGEIDRELRRGKLAPESTRLSNATTASGGPQVLAELLYQVMDALDEIVAESGESVAQVALNWVLQRPSVSTVIIGARNAQQLRQNIEAVGWNLTPEQVPKLDDVRIKTLA